MLQNAEETAVNMEVNSIISWQRAQNRISDYLTAEECQGSMLAGCSLAGY
jgi:hypothetical protein